ncbi:tubulin delta chain-like [Tribolium castaneum]|uniref:tubulin delta chain-like n=1 Tax=Tribolium castaneum TaxID=7070 RepID=UPI00077DBB0F|nr:PREDICTED: tubulin delta chain [Tribolium castaneum]|eukprot:XP_015833579.1 PREDICTED: tubulin delta chain [Tribolium castaneum]
MSVIGLFYGQCGNQICDSFYTNIYNDLSLNPKHCDYYSQSLNKWFNVTKTKKLVPKSILIDTESKTILHKKSCYQFRNIISKSSGGSANNWAFGYFHQSKLLLNDTLECVRKELEKTDLLSSFLNVFSSSGGTGSGVGSCIVEHLKNEFPHKTFVNALILPYSSGEVVIQSYNSLLTLSKIYSISNAILMFENDRLHYNCINSLNIKDVTFDDINNLLSHQLLSVYQPLNAQTSDLLTKLCDNSHKLLQIRSAPLSKLDCASNWKSLLTSISRQSRFDFLQKNQHKSLSTALICRGDHNPNENDLKPFKDSNSSKTFQLYHQKRKLFNLENCLTVVSNTNNICGPLDSILQDAKTLYKFGAYLHHYEKFGVGQTHFKTAFDTCESILNDYKKL